MALHGVPVARGAARPRIAIVGAGLAGLNCAWQLRKAGLDATLYEGSDRLGGRLNTAHALLAPGLVTELGGEFINSDHIDMLALAQEFALPLHDRADPSEAAFREGFFFDGRLIGEAELAAVLRPVATRIATDAARIEDDWDRTGRAFDRLSLGDYLDRLDVRGWLRDLFDAAMVPEFGLEASDQTCLNLLWLMPTVAGGKVSILGASDERFKLVDGNHRIAWEIGRLLQDSIRTGAKLTGIVSDGTRAVLRFGETETVADHVVLALPFSTLRAVEMRMDMPATLRRFIAEVGYGTNAKVMTGFNRRRWRETGSSGQFYADLGFQSCWDSAQRQPGEAGAITFFLGGITGRSCDTGPAEDYARTYVGALDRLVPGIAADHNGSSARFHWQSHPWTRGSYACFKPGQYTEFVQKHVWLEGEDGEQDVAAGNILFAGEHVSDAFQGYMNGAAQTGRLAAAALLKRLA